MRGCGLSLCPLPPPREKLPAPLFGHLIGLCVKCPTPAQLTRPAPPRPSSRLLLSPLLATSASVCVCCCAAHVRSLDDVLLAHLKAEVADERSEFIKARKSPHKSPRSRPHEEPGFPVGKLVARAAGRWFVGEGVCCRRVMLQMRAPFAI